MRAKALPMPALRELDANEHNRLKASSVGNKNAWSPKKSDPLYSLVGKFRADVKAYYRWRQGQKCCYCSSPLPLHPRCYDADHIVDKNHFPHFTFELNNFAASCAIYNIYKSDKYVLAEKDKLKIAHVPNTSADYEIVHPHYDEWGDYFKITKDNRVRPLKGKTKAAVTFDMCSIEITNFTRLASKFGAHNSEEAYHLLCSIIIKKQKKRIKAMLAVLERLADGLPEAEAVVQGLRKTLDVM
jgi:hypothetical protein